MVEINFVKSCGDKVRLNLSSQDVELLSNELISSSQRQNCVFSSSNSPNNSPINSLNLKKPPVLLLSPISSQTSISIRNTYDSSKTVPISDSEKNIDIKMLEVNAKNCISITEDDADNISLDSSPIHLPNIVSSSRKSPDIAKVSDDSLNCNLASPLSHHHQSPTESSEPLDPMKDIHSKIELSLSSEKFEMLSNCEGNNCIENVSNSSPPKNDSKLDSFFLGSEPDFMYNDMDFYNNHDDSIKSLEGGGTNTQADCSNTHEHVQEANVTSSEDELPCSGT